MLVGEFCDYRHQHWEGLVLVSLKDVQEIVILEEAHSAVSHLQVNTTDAPHNTLE